MMSTPPFDSRSKSHVKKSFDRSPSNSFCIESVVKLTRLDAIMAEFDVDFKSQRELVVAVEVKRIPDPVRGDPDGVVLAQLLEQTGP